jgi:hypothetical protein
MNSQPTVNGEVPCTWERMHFAFVTLWGGRAHAERVLEWLATAEMPPHSVLYWLDNSGGKISAELRAAWQERLRHRFLRLALMRGGAPYRMKPGETGTDPGRHVHIARLYDRILSKVKEDVVVCLEDDVVPPRDGVRSLFQLMQSAPRIGVASGIYRDRLDPPRIVAARHKRYWLNRVSWDGLPAEPFEVGMTGGGFIMLTNRALQQALPAKCRRFENGQATGWDGKICTDLTALGYRVMVHPRVRCAHLCPEVMEYEARRKK